MIKEKRGKGNEGMNENTEANTIKIRGRKGKANENTGKGNERELTENLMKERKKDELIKGKRNNVKVIKGMKRTRQ